MKRGMLIQLFITSGLLFSFSGCAPYEEVRETIYMQDAKMKVPLLQIPVFINTGDSTSIFEVTPRIFLGESKSFKGSAGEHTLVNSEGIFQVDTVWDGASYYYLESPGVNVYSPDKENYEVNAMLYNIGFDANLNVTKAFALTGGYNYSSVSGIGLEGFRGGIAFKKYTIPYGVRFDAGVIWQESYYDVSSVVITESKEWSGGTLRSIAFFRDEGIQNNASLYLNLSLTFYDGITPLGGFLNLGYFKQTLLDIEPRDYDQNYYVDDNPFTIGGKYTTEDLRSSVSTAFINFTPGLFFNLMPSARVVGGLKVIAEIGEIETAGVFLSPFVQLMFGF